MIKKFSKIIVVLLITMTQFSAVLGQNCGYLCLHNLSDGEIRRHSDIIDTLNISFNADSSVVNIVARYTNTQGQNQKMQLRLVRVAKNLASVPSGYATQAGALFNFWFYRLDETQSLYWSQNQVYFINPFLAGGVELLIDFDGNKWRGLFLTGCCEKVSFELKQECAQVETTPNPPVECGQMTLIEKSTGDTSRHVTNVDTLNFFMSANMDLIKIQARYKNTQGHVLSFKNLVINKIIEGTSNVPSEFSLPSWAQNDSKFYNLDSLNTRMLSSNQFYFLKPYRVNGKIELIELTKDSILRGRVLTGCCQVVIFEFNLKDCGTSIMDPNPSTCVDGNGNPIVVTTVLPVISKCSPADTTTIIQTLTSVNGCDSIVIQKFQLANTLTTVLPVISKCSPADTTTIIQTLTSVNGCDSIVIQKFQLANTLTTVLPVISKCSPADTTTIIQTLTSVNGCDSIVIQKFQLANTLTTVLPVISKCSPADTTTIIQTLTSVNGCDSIVIQKFQLANTLTTVLPVISKCSPADTTTIIQTLTSVNGCDSIVIQKFQLANTLTTVLPVISKCSPADTTTIIQTLTSVNGCDSIVIQRFIYTLLQNSLSKTDVTCFGYSDGSIDQTLVSGTLPVIYSWSNGSTAEDPTDLSAGIYSVTVTDANGCTTRDSITITQPTAITTAITTIKATCAAGARDGSATATISGGTTPYHLEWSNGTTTDSTISNLSAGYYSLAVKDANACAVLDTFSVHCDGCFVFPNPAQLGGEISVNLDPSLLETGETLTFELKDLWLRSVFSTTQVVENRSLNNQFTILPSGVSAGNYVLIISGKNIHEAKKIQITQ